MSGVYSLRVARRALRKTLAASAAGRASASMRPTSQPGATPESANALMRTTAQRMRRRQKLVIDEQADQFLDDCANHASAAALGLRSATRPKATARNRAIKARMAASPPGQSDAKALAGPEQAEGREHHADREFERILRHPRERAVDRRANGRHHDAGRQSACARQPEKAAPRADGDDDERDLDPFHEHDLERG